MTAPSKNLPKSLLDNPLLGSWIGFEETGRVRLATGKVEIGQGVLTALAQIAAEELAVTPARLRVVSGETPTSPREGFTSGSNSIAVSGASIRLVCAEVRTLFLRHVADRLACPVGALSIEDGRFMRAGRHVGQDYAEEVFWLAIDPGTYRSLTLGRGLSPAGFETWIRNLYDKMLLH